MPPKAMSIDGLALSCTGARVCWSGFVDQPLDFADGRVVYGPDGFPTARAFDGSLKAHRLVTHIEFMPANRAVGLGQYVVQFMRHT